MLQGTDTPTTMPLCPADGAILVPTALTTVPTISDQHTCSQGVIHLDDKELVPLHPTFPDNPASLVTASAATSNGLLLCGQANGQQVVSELDPDHPDSLLRKAAAGAVDSIVDDLVEDAVAHHDMATACVVDAVVEQLVNEANYDSEAADYAMNQRREAATAVDCVLDQLVSDAVAEDEAAQLEVVDIVLDELVSNTVVDAEAAQAEVLSDLKLSQAVDTLLEQVISSVMAEVQAESAAAMCQSFTVQSCLSEPNGNLSKELSMQSTAGAHQAVGSLPSYSPPSYSPFSCSQPSYSPFSYSQPSYSQREDAVSSGAAARQQVQQLRREMALLSGSTYTELYQVPPIPASHLPS